MDKYNLTDGLVNRLLRGKYETWVWILGPRAAVSDGRSDHRDPTVVLTFVEGVYGSGLSAPVGYTADRTMNIPTVRD